MPRIAVGIEYDGSAYSGWQRQAQAPSIEAAVSAALSRVANAEINLMCAGRTDAGVHALAQVAHFDTVSRRSARAWVLGANTELAPEIRLIWAREVPEHFHARFSAEWRRYRYLILNRAVNSALTRNRAAWVRSALSLEPMRRAAAGLTGEHDFSSFRAAECQARSPVRRLTRLSVTAEGGFIAIEAEANAFLHHMVRNLAGFLIAVGSGERTPESAAELLAQRDRRLAPPTAPPQGLYLAAVGYPAAFRLPAASGALAN